MLEKYEFWMWVFVVVYNLSFKCENMEIVLGGTWMVIPTMSVVLLFAEVLIHCEGVYWCLQLFTNILTHECMLGHQTLGVCDAWKNMCIAH